MIHSAEEAHFLVRVGQWSIERLEQWALDRINAEYQYDDNKEEYTEWDEKQWEDDDF